MSKQVTYPRFQLAALLLIIQVGLLLFVHQLTRDVATAASQPLDEQPLSESGVANCRYGAIALSGSHVDWLDDLGAGWYSDFAPNGRLSDNFAEFVPIVFVKQDKDKDGNYLSTYTIKPSLGPGGLGADVAAQPGRLWIVGNEIDRGPNPGETETGQGDTFPDVYVQAYHEVYQYIKSQDPTAQVAPSALVQVTPGRLQYLDNMWNAYHERYHTALPADVWAMHVYVLPEAKPDGQPNAIANIALGTDPSLARKESGFDASLCPLDEVYCFAEHDDISVFAEQVVAMRTWMYDHGYQYLPLIITEFSILYPYEVFDDGTCFLGDEFGNCFPPSRVVNFMNNAFDYLTTARDPQIGYKQDDNRLVQQWLWFSVYNAGVGSTSNLIDGNPFSLTAMGQTFQDAVFDPATEYTVNLYPTGANYPVLSSPGTPVTATLQVSLRNNGSAPAAQDFKVTFYKNAALTQEIGRATISKPHSDDPGMTGCARRELVAEVDWTDLGPGVYPYWAKIDSTNQIGETDEGDNLINALVIVGGERVYMPHFSSTN